MFHRAYNNIFASYKNTYISYINSGINLGLLNKHTIKINPKQYEREAKRIS